MKLIHYVKLHNFKVFGDDIIIDLDQPSVLIGPNNSGKTSALQALALWSMGVKRWWEAKKDTKAKKNLTVGINRLEIVQVPVQETRFYWNKTEVRKGNSPGIPLEITVGLWFNGKVEACKLSFTHYPELVYCLPDIPFYTNRELMEYAASLNVNILYPMSGLGIDEAQISKERIDFLIGEGKTAEVLRNLCYQITENHETSVSDWRDLNVLMEKLFSVELLKPVYNKIRGTIELKYKSRGIKNPLDISLAGRGMQQILLLVAYILSHKNSVLLLDEPDAHLEILRQKVVFYLLNDLAQQNSNQIIIATHSEVVLNEATDNNLVLLIDGDSINLAKKNDIKSALGSFGMEHYYKARLKKSILYIEGSTDVQILKAFAELLHHEKALEILNSNFNYYYTQNTEPSLTSDVELDIRQGYYDDYKKHYYAIKSVVPDFKGLAIFDSDGRHRDNESKSGLTTLYWQQYEIENYFIRPSVIEQWKDQTLDITGTIFELEFEKAFNTTTLEMIFSGNRQALDEFNTLTPALQNVTWKNNTGNIKISSFFEQMLTRYSELSGQPVPINKGRYYELVQYLPVKEVDREVIKALEDITVILA